MRNLLLACTAALAMAAAARAQDDPKGGGTALKSVDPQTGQASPAIGGATPDHPTQGPTRNEKTNVPPDMQVPPDQGASKPQ